MERDQHRADTLKLRAQVQVEALGPHSSGLCVARTLATEVHPGRTGYLVTFPSGSVSHLRHKGVTSIGGRHDPTSHWAGSSST